ncbi:type I restriction endonuclease subunit R [Methanolobus profundi]|uniref:type I site-specific deoxyribonuclease n=1 Tax=Methanolobus profundi TaxID=487685 RepID=A0A1I4QJV0_9EURY|nr:type I restriction endonuclease subunit R [Methanolobus profundi]SFM40402.1 type I restriction enzyme, R subunit [Methanolobus profundi]
MFNEENTTEQMIIATAKNNGWTYIKAEKLPRKYSDVLVEQYLADALIRLNPEIAAQPQRADEVLYRLRAILLSCEGEGIVRANEHFTSWLRGEKTMPFGENGEHTPVKLIDFEDYSNNQYIVTNQWVYPAVENGKRLDITLLVNGIPLVIGECKTPVRPAITWVDAAEDINNYEKSIPQMFVSNVFNFGTEGKCYRYGSIKMPLKNWGPWYSDEDHSEGTIESVRRSITSMIRTDVILDMAMNFTTFATNKKHQRVKIIARYQQYEGANMIVDRVVAGMPKKGLIWHFQGSGKSLLMVFAAQKLRMHPALKNPTVIVVVDRTNLDTQITATFNSVDIPNIQGASKIAELTKYLKQDTRKILITTIFKFRDVTETLNERENIIVLVDEAHRTQEGDLGLKMRLALPNAFMFGLTGTPINKLDKNTFVTFGADEDERGYMSRYTYVDSIKDGATLPLHFEPVEPKLHIKRDAIDQAFDAMTDQLSDDDKDELTKKAAKMAVLLKSPDRVQAVCGHIANHFQTKVRPNAFKGQVVTFDRECCVLYKNELDKLLGPESSAIVMHTNNDKGNKFAQYRLSKDEEEKLLDRFRDPSDPLQLLIVTSKLLTGFDAPILQTMYLDKAIKDHSLLQAICRTNRIYKNKTHGLIVDYLGIFDNALFALQFDEQIMKKVITDIADIKEKLPELVVKCLSYFPDIDRTLSGYEALEEAQNCLKTDEVKDSFAANFSVLHNAWEALSPDPILASYESDYKWLSHVYESLKPVSGMGSLLWHSFGAKTIELIHKNVVIDEVRDDLENMIVDADLLEGMFSGNPDKKGREIEIVLIARLRKHAQNPVFIELGERLDKLRLKHEQGLLNSIEFLKSLLILAKDVVAAEQKVEPVDEQEKAKSALTELFIEAKCEKTPAIVERIVNDIDEIVRAVRFPGWQNTSEGVRTVKQSLLKTIRVKYKITDKEVYDKSYSYIEMYY